MEENKTTKLLILAVDALDYETAKKLGYPKMPYECKMSIPKELYHKNRPHSLKVWPSMFTGRTINTKIWGRFGEVKYWIRKIVRGILRTLGQEEFLKKAKMEGKGGRLVRASTNWKTRADNVDEETVFDNYNSLIWNIPTLTPECLMHFPSRGDMYKYAVREYDIWKMVVLGMIRTDREICATYTHILDVTGHLMMDDRRYYMDISKMVDLLKKIDENVEIIVVSDHGMENGKHTEYAYIGSTTPIKCETVMDVRPEIERIMNI